LLQTRRWRYGKAEGVGDASGKDGKDKTGNLIIPCPVFLCLFPVAWIALAVTRGIAKKRYLVDLSQLGLISPFLESVELLSRKKKKRTVTVNNRELR